MIDDLCTPHFRRVTDAVFNNLRRKYGIHAGFLRSSSSMGICSPMVKKLHNGT